MRASLTLVAFLACPALIGAAQTPPPRSPPRFRSPLSLPLGIQRQYRPRKNPADEETESGQTSPPAEAGKAPVQNPYRIGALDVLYVRVWNNTNLTGMVNVQDDGTISLPLIGQVRADGLTVEELRQAITTKLDDYIQHPDVSVDVTKNNSKKFYIIGGVNHPGPYPLNGKLTISEALASAGGFHDFAHEKKIYLIRGKDKHLYNNKEVKNGKNLEQDIEVQNGDKIYVPE